MTRPRMDVVLDTDRLLLRRFDEGDVDVLYELCSRPEIIRYAQSVPLASLEEARAMLHSAPLHDYATRGYGRLACVWKDTGAVVGFSGVKHVASLDEDELGYRFLPEYWGRGLATEAGAAVVDYARSTLGLGRLVALIHPDNVGSARVVGKLGFTLERQVDYAGLPGIPVDLYTRSL